MSFQPQNADQSFVPNDLIIPDDYKEMQLIMTDYLRSVVDSLNEKEIANFSTAQSLTGQKWLEVGNENNVQQAYRKVIDFGSLPNTAAKAVAHGITTTQNTYFTHIYATATDPGATDTTAAIPIPYVDPNTLANGIQIDVDNTNVTITTAANYSAYTKCYVVLEWVQN